MHCFICNLCCNDKYENSAAIFISDRVTKKTTHTYGDMLKGFFCELDKFNVHISESDVICKTCQNLIECYDTFYYEAKICQELLMRQVYRNFKIPKAEQRLSLNLLDYDVKAASCLYSNNNQKIVYECKECEYKTKYTDTLASHYKFHKCSSDYMQENSQNFLKPSISTSYITIKPKITLPLPTPSPTIEIYDNNITNNNKVDTGTDSNTHNFEFINVSDNNHYNTIQVEQNMLTAQKEIGFIEEIDEDMDFLNEELPSDLFNKAILSNKFVCGHCNKHFLIKSKFDVHVKLHSKNFGCSYCEYIAKDKQVMQTHIRDNHSSNLNYCEVCDEKTLMTPCDHSNTIKRFNRIYCKYCHSYFQTSDNFTKHNILLHLNCYDCHQQFQSKKLAIKHMYCFHAGLRIIRCRGCKKSFKTPMEKKLHICNGEYKLKCKLCPKAFITITLLREHLAGHSNKALYVCDECGQTFQNGTTYLIHKKYHINPKPYKCNICGFALSTPSGLRVHIRRHNGELEYKCDYCDKKFVTLTLKTWHEGTHTGNYRFNCTECTKGFNKRYLYVTHLRVVHKNYKMNKYQCQYKMALPKQSLASTV